MRGGNLHILENKLVGEVRRKQAPRKALEIYEDEALQGVPTGIGYDETLGWFVLQTSGQGPYLIWSEREEK